jgi:phage gp46-like protein
MATSSAIELADLALTWVDQLGAADLSMIDSDIASDRTMVTAVILSIFVDRRADPDDVPPSGDPTDMRGWWADQFSAVEGDRIGSRLWLLDRAKLTSETARNAEGYIREALAWMIEDRVVSSVDVETVTTAASLLIGVTLHRPGRDPLALRFTHVWDHV